ncbi:MAG: sulfite exporter TauE/SafE family protein [Magnetococcus sp. DMHC-1]|nr:sulfite exporter TauE/SafE family protein [Magnetococcales bacterium]
MDDTVAQAATFSATALLGLTMGLTACSAFCLPYFGTWMMGRGVTTQPWQDAGSFLLGRLTAYTLLGGMAAGVGNLAWLAWLENTGRLALAGLVLSIGGWLLLSPVPKPITSCRNSALDRTLPPFALGLTLSLVPCLPLLTLLASCALAGGVIQGLLQGALFGLTASLAPIFLATVVLGGIGRGLIHQQPRFAPWLRRGAGLILVAMAVSPLATLFAWIGG